MPICIKHNQTYNMDEYCVYCGDPVVITTESGTGKPMGCCHGRPVGQPCPHCLGLNN